MALSRADRLALEEDYPRTAIEIQRAVLEMASMRQRRVEREVQDLDHWQKDLSEQRHAELKARQADLGLVVRTCGHIVVVDRFAFLCGFTFSTDSVVWCHQGGF